MIDQSAHSKKSFSFSIFLSCFAVKSKKKLNQEIILNQNDMFFLFYKTYRNDLKQERIHANGIRKIQLIQQGDKLIFLNYYEFFLDICIRIYTFLFFYHTSLCISSNAS